MTKILVVNNVSKRFGQLAAVNKLSFEVQQGEIFGIAGPNGSGKSTLFNLLTRIPFGSDSGNVFFGGAEVTRLPPNQICRLGLVRTFQKETVFDSLTVYQNALMGSVYGRGRNKFGDGAAMEALADVDLLEKREQLAGTLSVFERKLLMFASAIAAGPKLLLLDEPASSLTSPEIEQLISLVHRLNEKGITIVVIEHVLPLLLSVSERLLVLNYGEKLVLGKPNKVIKDERVVEAYLGR